MVQKKEGNANRTRTTKMAFLSEDMFDRANRAMLITTVGGGLAACALGASIYDIGDWLCFW
jgi:hypothetical protein